MDLMRSDPELGLKLVLAIVDLGPLHGLDEWGVHSPLLDLIRLHGPAVIQGIEAAAKNSEALRRVIWDLRRLKPRTLEFEVWERFMNAAGTTTLYNSDQPAGARPSLSPEWTELLERWFISQSTFWAWCEVDELVRDDHEAG
jgi:hypothetical protein